MKPRIRMQLPSNLERSSPYSPQRANYCLRLGSAPQKGHQSVVALPEKLKGSASAPKVSSAPSKGQESVITLPEAL
jgi:hypothetical protein